MTAAAGAAAAVAAGATIAADISCCCNCSSTAAALTATISYRYVKGGWIACVVVDTVFLSHLHASSATVRVYPLVDGLDVIGLAGDITGPDAVLHVPVGLVTPVVTMAAVGMRVALSPAGLAVGAVTINTTNSNANAATTITTAATTTTASATITAIATAGGDASSTAAIAPLHFVDAVEVSEFVSELAVRLDGVPGATFAPHGRLLMDADTSVGSPVTFTVFEMVFHGVVVRTTSNTIAGGSVEEAGRVGSGVATATATILVRQTIDEVFAQWKLSSLLFLQPCDEGMRTGGANTTIPEIMGGDLFIVVGLGCRLGAAAGCTLACVRALCVGETRDDNNDNDQNNDDNNNNNNDNNNKQQQQ
jgi:hypothetical protein